jgi:DNA-directed RNA polymerase specialized sigma24 family protein
MTKDIPTPGDQDRYFSSAVAALQRVALLDARQMESAEPELAALDALAALAARVERHQRDVVASLRARGCSWGQIAEPLGVTRSAAQQRFGSGSSGGKVGAAGGPATDPLWR